MLLKLVRNVDQGNTVVKQNKIYFYFGISNHFCLLTIKRNTFKTWPIFGSVQVPKCFFFNVDWVWVHIKMTQILIQVTSLGLKYYNMSMTSSDIMWKHLVWCLMPVFSHTSQSCFPSHKKLLHGLFSHVSFCIFEPKDKVTMCCSPVPLFSADSSHS